MMHGRLDCLSGGNQRTKLYDKRVFQVVSLLQIRVSVRLLYLQKTGEHIDWHMTGDMLSRWRVTQSPNKVPSSFAPDAIQLQVSCVEQASGVLGIPPLGFKLSRISGILQLPLP